MDTPDESRELRQRIFKLAGGKLRFKQAFNTPEELLTVGASNSAELARLEQMGVSDRIWDLLCLISAEALQPAVLAKYGDASATSLRQYLLDRFFRPANEWERTKQLARAAFATGGFTEKQLEPLYTLVDAMPYLIVEEIVTAVAPLFMVPREESSKLTGILAEMIQELTDADSNRSN